MKTLVLGIGNPLRGDDAAGWILAERVASRALPDVEVRTLPQLQIELVADWAQRDRVVVLDAAVGIETVSLQRLDEASGAGAASHDLPAAALLGLARHLHGRAPEVFLCSIPGARFDLGKELSTETASHLEKALAAVVDLLKPESISP